MAWIYLAESEDSQKPWKVTSSQSPIVKTTGTLKLCCLPVWRRVKSHSHPSGTIYEPCNQEVLPPSTSSMGDFPAKTLALQAAEQAWQASAADYFLKSLGSLAKFDPDSCSWRTFQLLIEGVEILSSELWPTSGMTLDGTCYPLPMWARTTSENDGGYWRTPDTGAGGTSGLLKQGKTHRESGAAITIRLVDQVNNPSMWPTPRANKTSSEDPETWAKRQKDGKVSTPPLGMAVKMWPTPTTRDDRGPASNQLDLGRAVKMWPTPTANANADCPSERLRRSPALESAVKMYPTPQARDWKDGTNPKPHGRHSESLPVVVNMTDGGSLNPTWVEWLMGYPCGWTDCAVWAIQWFRPKRVKRLKG